MPVLLSLHFPTWNTDLVRRRWHLESNHAIILSRVDHQREIVAHACLNALRAGVTPGMTIAHAKALLPSDQAHVEQADAEASMAALRRFAVWLIRFAPLVAIDPPDGIWLDATGCERLYGSVNRLCDRILYAIRSLRIMASLAAAPTWGAAWALARFGDGDTSRIVNDASQLCRVLAPLPVAALRLNDATLDKLHRIGLRCIGHLLDLPRAALADRYGEDLLLRLDQALGQAVEVIAPIRPHAPLIIERLFDGPTDRLEAIELAAREVVSEIAAQLAIRESGTRALQITLFRSDLEPLTLWVRTARPARDAKHLWKLLAPKIESAHLGFGVEGVRGHAQSLARLRHEQQQAWEKQAKGLHHAEVGRLVDTLSARLGPGRVLRAVPVESHLPERAMTLESGFDVERPACGGVMVEADRPSLLLRRPIPIHVMFLVPDGPIGQVVIGNDRLRVLACIGPERIEPEWWRCKGPIPAASRDYFKVQTEIGRWLWVYRDVTGNRWHLHGEWA